MLDPRQKQKNNNDRLLSKDKDKALLYEIERINDNLSDLQEKIKEKDNSDLIFPLEKLNNSLLTLQDEVKKKDNIQLDLELSESDFKGITGENGKDGYTPILGIDFFTLDEVKEFKKEVTPVKGVDYFDGEPGQDGTPGDQGKEGIGIQGKPGKQGRPPKHEIKNNSIRFENPDGTWGQWIKLSEAKFEGFKKKTLHRGGMDYIVEDLSSQCDGSNMVFTTVNSYKAGTVYLSSTQFPIVYRKEIDFLDSADKEITLVAAQVGPPQEDQTLMIQYVKS